MAGRFLREALSLYKKWGADAKVQHLEDEMKAVLN
jgi:hypothetical protein